MKCKIHPNINKIIFNQNRINKPKLLIIILIFINIKIIS